MLKAMPLSVYGNIPYEDIPECVDPIFQNPILTEAESSREDTDNYWPPDKDDPITELYIDHTEVKKQKPMALKLKHVDIGITKPSHHVVLKQEKGTLLPIPPKHQIIKAKPTPSFKISVHGLKKR